MTRPQAVALGLGLVFIFAVALVADVGSEQKTSARGDGRGVSAPTAGVLGTLLGVALGLFGDRVLRQQGDVHCELERLDLTDNRESPPRLRVDQSVQAHFFNDKEVDTGLSEITVVFVFESGEEVVLGPGTRGYETSTSPLGVINLPSKTWVSVHVKGYFIGPLALPFQEDGVKAIEIKGKFPGGKPYHKRCVEFPVPF
jgi:hypothetical protein